MGNDVPAPAEPISEAHTPSERQPFPEDVLRQLNVTRLEEMEFFVEKGKYGLLTEDQEQELLVEWLEEKR